MTAPTVSETLVRVNYSETDQMGVVYHARYLVWLDVARTEHLRAVRGELSRARGRRAAARRERGGHPLPPAGPLRRPGPRPLLGPRGRVTRRVEFGYAVEHAEDGRLLATATVALLALDASMALTRLPDDVSSHAAPDPGPDQPWAHLSDAGDTECIDAIGCPGPERRGPWPGAVWSSAARSRARSRPRSRASSSSSRRVLAAEDARDFQPDLFRRALVAPDSLVRRVAALGAGRIGDLRATPLVVPLLADPDSTVRVAAAFALGLLGDTAGDSAADRPAHRPAGARRHHRGRGRHRAGQDRRAASGDFFGGVLGGKVPLSQDDRPPAFARRSSASPGGWARMPR